MGWIREKLRVAAGLSQVQWTRARIRWTRARLALEPWTILIALLELALWERVCGLRRRIGRGKPRLLWGPVPLLSLKFWSEAMRDQGYESITCVSHHLGITRREDFDVYRDRFSDGSPASERRADYRFFAWTLRHGDVFLRFLDGGFLRHTRLDRWEAPLLRIAGKKLIVSPYGGDIAVVGHLREIEELVFEEYPSLRADSELTKRRVLHTLRWANLSIANWQDGFLPSYDVIWPTMVAIDTDLWSPGGELARDADGTEAAVSIVHTPNHRLIKGTEYLERAVEELRRAGLRIELQILQGVPNDELRELMRKADIAADQFHGGYAMNAIEGMALGKPVLSSMRTIPEPVRGAEALRDCPIVETGPQSLREDLRRLIEDPRLRDELGRAGREYVLRHHSYEAVGHDWEAVIEHTWRRAPLVARDAIPASR